MQQSEDAKLTVGAGFDGRVPVQRVVGDMEVRGQGHVVVDHQCKLVFLQFPPDTHSRVKKD